MSRAREGILQRIRGSVSGAPESRAEEYQAIVRSYARAGTRTGDSLLDLFTERLRDYGAEVLRCPEEGVPQAISQALTARHRRCLLIPGEVPRKWLPSAPFEFFQDDGLSYEVIDRSEGVLTGCVAAIALTGTIILRHSPASGRRALTLIPDYHLCVVSTDQIVETVSEAMGMIAEFRRDPLTTISGPSATSDIEMTRIKGVHGPRTLDVILVNS